MEKMGIHKRDILVDRVEDARDAQAEAQTQFKSALEQFSSVVQVENTDLKAAYEKLNSEYEESEAAAKNVTDRIDKVRTVADALFREWEEELELYESAELKKSSKTQLLKTKEQYNKMLQSMIKAESSMAPVLRTFRDNVLYLKHNLNAQAIGSLRVEFKTLKEEIDKLIAKMNDSIATSNSFISNLEK
ncbi:MAG: DUF2959 domain-containing protein [Desulfatiglans sp.]|jgi:DNA repair exonuclease SbcCD ATPase subunit|nr:DUF2959 domain-containing protein [Desulfatiglans sp.]